MKESEVYKFYNDRVKIVYSEIEARNNTLPVELLFEIHSAFDHLKRFHLEEEPEDKCCEKAFSHLKRGLLDAFKLKLKYHNDEYKKLTSGKSDLKLIDNGNFLPNMLEKRKDIIKKAKEARVFEGKSEIDSAFERWYEVSELIDIFEENYFSANKIGWARHQRYWQTFRNIGIGILTGVIGTLLVQLIISLVQKR